MAANQPMLCLGLDAGSLKTACVALLDRTVVARYVAGPCNWAHSDRAQARAELLKAISGCLAGASRTTQQVACVCIGTAGVDNPDDVVALQQTLRAELHSGVEVLIYSDAVTALASGTGGVLHGCVLIAGTGTVAFGMCDGGRLQARASGWGPAFMDGGSGYDIGSRALSAISKAHDGRGAETILVEAITQHLGVSKPEDLIRWAYAEPSWQRIAALAPIVVECAVQGDSVADTILKHGVGELFRSVKAVVTRLDLDRQGQGFQLVLAGGLLTEGCLYTQYLLETLKEVLPTAEVMYPAVEPAEAAAWLAHNAASSMGPAVPIGGTGPAPGAAGGAAAAPAGASDALTATGGSSGWENTKAP